MKCNECLKPKCEDCGKVIPTIPVGFTTNPLVNMGQQCAHNFTPRYKYMSNWEPTIAWPYEFIGMYCQWCGIRSS